MKNEQIKWQKIGDHEFHFADRKMNWHEAMEYAKSIGARLPYRWELCKWIDEDGYKFPSRWVWSASSCSSATSYAWYVYLVFGYTNFNYKSTSSNYVVCVQRQKQTAVKT